jgi:hypothetical protein
MELLEETRDLCRERFFCQYPTVDLVKPIVSPVPKMMDKFSNELFSCPLFTLNEHGDIVIGSLLG